MCGRLTSIHTLHGIAATAAISMAMLAVTATSCGRNTPSGDVAPTLCTSRYNITPDSVALGTGMAVCTAGDTLLRISVEGNTLRTISIGEPEASRGAFEFKSDFPIFDALFRLEQARPQTQVFTWLTPFELWLNPFVGAEGEKLLFSRLRNGHIVPAETRRFGWPVINDSHQWLMAATELFNITANRASLATLGEAAANVDGIDTQVMLNQSTGLISGVPRYIAESSQAFPQWMGPEQFAVCSTFAVNAMHWAWLSTLHAINTEMAQRNERSHLPDLSADHDSIRHDVFRNFWNPQTGNFDAMLYGYALTQLPLEASDNIAQSIAIIAGLPLPDMTASIARHFAADTLGTEIFTPRLSASPHRPHASAETLALTLRAVAMSRTSYARAYNLAAGALISHVCSDLLSSRPPEFPAFRQPLSSLVLRGFCGIHTAFDGLRFTPSVPTGMSGTMHISHLRYRRSELSITIRGTGSSVASFAIDGKPSDQCFYPASSEGKHHIEITLEQGPHPESQTAVALPGVLPPAPAAMWATDRLATIAGKNNFLWRNGVETDSVTTGRFQLFDTNTTAILQFATVTSDGTAGFATSPHIFIPQKILITVPLAKVAKGGTRLIADRRWASRMVESHRYRNSVIRFTVDVPRTGRYAADVGYINGLGIVNPRLRTALRSLYVDGSNAGIMVFTQLSPLEWDPDPERHWEEHTAFSNPIELYLTEGEHTLELRFFQPSPVYVDPLRNTLLADCLRLYLLPQ